MKKFFTSDLGWLRIFGLFEGLSLILLVFIAMPLKYGFDNPTPVRIVGMAHGFLFLAFVALTLLVAIRHRWKLFGATWKVLLSCLIPFGTFYVDKKILAPRHETLLQEA